MTVTSLSLLTMVLDSYMKEYIGGHVVICTKKWKEIEGIEVDILLVSAKN